MPLLNRSHSNLQKSSRPWQQYTVWFSITSTVCITAAWILKDAIAPVAVQAVPLRGNVMLDVQAGETYDAFMQRATAAAKAATQGTFNRNSSISDLSLVVTGQNRGATVQVLTLRANRNQWRSNPNAGRWATYYPTAQSLLGLAPQPVVTPTVNAQSGNTQQTGTVQQPGIGQPIVPGQPLIVLPFPGQSAQPTLNSGTAIAPNGAVTLTQPINGTNGIPSPNTTSTPSTYGAPSTSPTTGTPSTYGAPITSPTTGTPSTYGAPIISPTTGAPSTYGAPIISPTTGAPSTYGAPIISPTTGTPLTTTPASGQ